MKYEDKIYLTQDKLLEKLKSDKLEIKNDNYAIRYFNEVGYYKLINGYKHCFKTDDNGVEQSEYLPDTTFEHIISLYTFDFKLRNLVFSNICIIESMLKSQISESFSKRYGTKDSDYFVEKNFKPDSDFYIRGLGKVDEKFSFEKIKKEIFKKIEKNSQNKNKSILNYSKKGYYPLWVLLNIMSFGETCIFYKKLFNELQIEIGKYFNLSLSTMHSYLSHLVLFRNACAHNEVIFNFKTTNRLKINQIESRIINIYDKLGIPKNKYNSYSNGTNNILSIFIVFKLLLPKIAFSAFKRKFFKYLNELSHKVNEISFNNIKKCMGIYTKESLLKKL